MPRPVPVLLLLLGLAACAQHPTTSHLLFDGKVELTLPADYVLYHRPQFGEPAEGEAEPPRIEFVRFGGNEALRRKFPDHPFSKTFLDDFAGKDVQANILVFLVDLLPEGRVGEWSMRNGEFVIPRDATARSIHERICRSFAARWGESGFDLYDADSGVGRCVNFGGAFITMFARRVGDHLVIISGLDFVEALIFEKKGPGEAFLEMTPEEKWRVFRDVANAEVAEPALLSARLR